MVETNIISKNIEESMKDAYLDYAMSVIIGRALPDVRDGLKPVHRRILYAMSDLNVLHTRPYMKSARIVGEVIGKYHPHGDAAVYDATVRMVQDFSLRIPLVDGQGNFGSVDGDEAAAMRYTEVRLAKVTQEFLQDLEKNTVDFIDNYDGSLREPTVLPTKVPNLLINGSSGIAVGMATNIPSHNLGEVIKGLLYYIDNRDCSIEDLMAYIPGPDFPTAGEIRGVKGIIEAYKTGRGIIYVRAKTLVEERPNGKEAIIVTELPYMVNKARLIEKIAELVKLKKIEGIQDLRDESDKRGMRIVIELKRNEDSESMIAKLYKNTSMQTSFGINLLAVVDAQPQLLNLKQILYHFLNHRIEIVTRRITFELAKAEQRAHILEGLQVAQTKIDEVVALIRQAKSTKEAKEGLMTSFALSDKQAQAILEMRLQRLTALEVEKLVGELTELYKNITWYKEVLANDTLLINIIKDELKEIDETYTTPRRTNIETSDPNVSVEELIPNDNMVVTMSRGGYIKRIALENYNTQNRGGKGKVGMGTATEDVLDQVYFATAHANLLIFTNQGRVFSKKIYELPLASRTAKGRAWINLIPLLAEEEVVCCMPIADLQQDSSIVMMTQNGVIKRTALSAYEKIRSTGVKSIVLDEGDKVISARYGNKEDSIFIATSNGMSLRFLVEKLREQGRVTRGVRGIKLREDDYVVSMEVIADENMDLMTITENGYAKKSKVSNYPIRNRAGVGIMNIRKSSRNGKVIIALPVTNESELILLTMQGKVMRVAVKQINITGRVTQGVRLISLEKEEKLVSAINFVLDE